MKMIYNNRIMVFGDLHAPYHDDNALSFLKSVKKQFKPDRVVCVGDLVDFYSASRFPKDPSHPDSLVNEIKKISSVVQKLAKIFPAMDITMGNHDDRLSIRANGAGIPRELMSTFGTIIDAPEGWVFHNSSEDLTLNIQATKENITFAHHRGVNTLLLAQRLGRSYVAGHSHTKGQVVGFNNGERTIFGVNNPCLISNTGSPFAYAKISNINPIKGCTLIEAGVPRLVLLDG